MIIECLRSIILITWQYLKSKVIYYPRILATLFLALFLYEVEKEKQTIELYEKVEETVINEAPWLLNVFYSTDINFLPTPWGIKNLSRDEILKLLFDFHQKAVDKIDRDSTLEYEMIANFREYFHHWSLLVSICNGEIIPAACNSQNYYAGMIDQKWSNIYAQNFIQEFYFFFDDFAGQVISGEPFEVSHLTCNFNPYSVNTEVIAITKSEFLIQYWESIGVSIAGEIDVFKSISNPGYCEYITIFQYDTNIDIKYSLYPNNKTFTTFVDNGLAIAGGVGYEIEEDTEAFYSEYVCIRPFKNHFTANLISEDRIQECDESNRVYSPQYYAEIFMPSEDSVASRAFALNQYFMVFDDLTTFPKTDVEISAAQILVIQMANVALEQWELYKKWSVVTPNFILSANIDDLNGYLGYGVYFNEGKPDGAYHEYIRIPEEGVIDELNGREIWSKYDIYEALHRHGHSRTAGIAVPLRIRMRGVQEDVQARYLFNESNLPYFLHVTNGFIEGFIESATFSQNWIACTGETLLKAGSNLLLSSITSDYDEGFQYRSFFKIHDMPECQWRKTQQYAYAAQAYPDNYDFGQIATYFLPTGAGAVKFFAGARLAKLSKPARLLVPALANTAENVLSAYMVQAPSLTFEEKMDGLELPAGIGFAAGLLSSVSEDEEFLKQHKKSNNKIKYPKK